MAYVMKTSLSSIDGDELRDNICSVLREKMPSNDIISSSSWRRDTDVLYHDKVNSQRLRFSESEKDTLLSNSESYAYTKRKYRTRSESEPIDWNRMANGSQRPATKLPPTPVSNSNRLSSGSNNSKRHSPPKVLLYNCQTPGSPRHTKIAYSGSHSRSSPASRRGSSLSRLNEFRRCRTKSPSPTYRSAKPLEETTAIVRQSKSATPPPIRMRKLQEKSSNCSTNIAKPVKETKPLLAKSKSDEDDYDSSIEDDKDFEPVSDNDCSIESSSDSEDGYKQHVFKNHSSDKSLSSSPFLLSSATDGSAQSINSNASITTSSSLFTPSLFPNVPVYLSFASNVEKGCDIPPELFKILKWKVTNVMPKLVRNVLTNSGVRLLKKTNDWMGTWGKHMKSPCFKTIRPYQKINHLPGSFKIGRKDSCWKNLQKQMSRHGKKEFGFMPKTYILPQDLNLLRKTWPKYAQRNFKWIIKPPASARGTGIKVVNRWAQIPKRKPLIVQKYIERPLLINGSKFDLRLYVLVTSMNPLRVYMYHDGLVRFASVKYSDKIDTLNDRCMHLTNYSINKLSSNYSKNEDVNACHGHKWTLKSLWTYLSHRGVNIDRLWAALRNLVLRTILAGESAINGMIKMNVESKYSCFELFGFDVLLDSELVPWLLEVNISPSLHSDLPLDSHVKAPLVQAVLNTALYNVPPKLSPEKQKEISAKLGVKGPLCYDKRLYINYLSRTEKIKHTQFTRKSLEDRDEYLDAILDELTPDDVRCLIVAEDELARCAPLERIFPTATTHKYLKYTESPRYYNRLLDAWEHRYSRNRRVGVQLLHKYCEDQYHLEVPPPPAKKDSNAKDNNGNRKDRIDVCPDVDCKGNQKEK